VRDEIPFNERLTALLAERKQDGAQAWLSKVSGVEPSTISRLLKGDRLPARETLELLAPALGMSVDELVLGTTAAERARSGPEYVSIDQFREALGKMLDFERRANDAEASSKQLRESHSEEAARARAASTKVVRLEEQLAEAKTHARALEKDKLTLQGDVRRYQDALEKAVADVSRLNVQIAELKKLATSNQKTTTVTAVLAGIAAVGGIVTAAHYLDPEDVPPAKTSKTPKRGKGT
jgi:transcriptional regulator with XRE-family HTH domain